MSEYVKIKRQILKDVADAIRVHRKTDQLFKPSEFAEVIQEMFVLPSGKARSCLFNLKTKSQSSGKIPEIQNVKATSILTKIALTSKAEVVLEGD